MRRVGGYGKVSGFRYMAHMTQKQMAEYLGVTVATYSSKERGINQFNDKEKLEMRTLFRNKIDKNLTIDEIFFDTEYVNIRGKEVVK